MGINAPVGVFPNCYEMDYICELCVMSIYVYVSWQTLRIDKTEIRKKCVMSRTTSMHYNKYAVSMEIKAVACMGIDGIWKRFKQQEWISF